MNSRELKDQIYLHATVVILGFTGILGNLISLDGLQLVFWRVSIALLALLPILLFWKRKKARLSLPHSAAAMGTGLVVGLHWITFFHAIKISNVSITLAALSATSLMVSLMEPLLFRKKMSWLEPILGLGIIGGLILIFVEEKTFSAGLYVGLFSAFLAAWFTLLNRKIAAQKNDPFVVCTYEMFGAALGTFLGVLILKNDLPQVPEALDTAWLLILGVICTALTFTLSIYLLERLTAYQVTLAVNMEPVYGFLLAAWIFKENQELSLNFYLGSAIIVASVFGYGFLKRRFVRPAIQ
jgi:drug/metabolite transporter (DMT)-like permease